MRDKGTRYFHNPLIGPRQRYEEGYTAGRDAGQLVTARCAGATICMPTVSLSRTDSHPARRQSTWTIPCQRLKRPHFPDAGRLNGIGLGRSPPSRRNPYR